MKRLRAAALAIFLVAVVGAGGCVAPPSWCRPGPVEYQEGRARVFDPYPKVEPGPAMPGSRPRQFEIPRAEVVRSQVAPQVNWLHRNWK